MIRKSRFAGWTLTSLLVLLSTAGCQPAGQDMEDEGTEISSAPDLAAIQQGIDATNAAAEEALTAGDIPGFVSRAYTEDATILPPGGPVISGKAAIEEFWTGAAEAMGMTGVDLVSEGVTPLAGDMAYEIGRATIHLGEGSAEVKYLVIWKRGEDGVWRWHVDIWNEMPAESM